MLKRRQLASSIASGDDENFNALISDCPMTKKQACVLILKAIENGRQRFLETLLSKFGVESACGSRPYLHEAAMRGHSDCVDVLVRHGCPVDTRNQELSAATHSAARAGHFSTLIQLAHLGCPIDSKNAAQQTPLHIAAEFGHAKCIEVLVQLGSTAIDEPDASNVTPLHVAALRGHFWAMATLLRLGSQSLNTRSGWIGTPFFIATLNYNDPKIVNLMKYFGAEQARQKLASIAKDALHRAPIDQDLLSDTLFEIYFSRSLVSRLLDWATGLGRMPQPLLTPSLA